MLFSFSKYEGTGNDFILIDDRKSVFPLCRESIIKLCNRRYGIGADGLILAHPSERADVSMRIFNSDGKEAEMCGNGLRCLVDFLYTLNLISKAANIETMRKIYPCRWGVQGVHVNMGMPKMLGDEDGGMLVDMGVPHLVYFVEDLRLFDEEAKIRFATSGVNINYATLDQRNAITMRTFERGVEAETPSCGSGAAAACCVAFMRFGLRGLIKVRTPSGESLDFKLLAEHKALKEIHMTGRVGHVFDGEVEL